MYIERRIIAMIINVSLNQSETKGFIYRRGHDASKLHLFFEYYHLTHQQMFGNFDHFQARHEEQLSLVVVVIKGDYVHSGIFLQKSYVKVVI